MEEDESSRDSELRYSRIKRSSASPESAAVPTSVLSSAGRPPKSAYFTLCMFVLQNANPSSIRLLGALAVKFLSSMALQSETLQEHIRAFARVSQGLQRCGTVAFGEFSPRRI